MVLIAAQYGFSLSSSVRFPHPLLSLHTVRFVAPGLTALKHPNIIRLVQHINSPQNVIMVFELAEGGDLYQFLCQAPGQRVDEEEGRSLFRQVGWCSRTSVSKKHLESSHRGAVTFSSPTSPRQGRRRS